MLLCLPASTAFGRTWKDQQGNVIEAKFVRYARGLVYLQRGTKIFSLPLESLSDEDQTHVKQFVNKQGGEKQGGDKAAASARDGDASSPTTNSEGDSEKGDGDSRSDGRDESRTGDGGDRTDSGPRSKDSGLDRFRTRRSDEAPTPTFLSPPPDPAIGADHAGAGGAAAAASVGSGATASPAASGRNTMEKMFKNAPGGVPGRSTQPTLTPKDGRITMQYQGSKTDRKDLSMGGTTYKSTFPDSSKGPQTGPQRPTSIEGYPGSSFGPGAFSGPGSGGPPSGIPGGAGAPSGPSIPSLPTGGYPGANDGDTRSSLPGRIPDSDYNGSGPLASRVRKSNESDDESSAGSRTFPAPSRDAQPNPAYGQPNSATNSNTTRDSKGDASAQAAVIPTPQSASGSGLPQASSGGTSTSPPNASAATPQRSPGSSPPASSTNSKGNGENRSNVSGNLDDSNSAGVGENAECANCGRRGPTSDGLCNRCQRQRDLEEIELRHRSEQRFERIVFIGMAACVSFLAVLVGRFMRG
jgi:hypothetical protein